MGIGVLVRFLEDLETGFFTGYWDRAILPEARRLGTYSLSFPTRMWRLRPWLGRPLWLTLDAHFLVLARGEGLTVLHPDIPPP